KDLGVDTDQLTSSVHERAAGIALVDGCVGLEKVLETAAAYGISRAAFGADDPGRDGLANAERIADREADIANAHLIGIAELQHGQVGGADLQNGEIAGSVGAHKFRGKSAGGAELDLNVLS